MTQTNSRNRIKVDTVGDSGLKLLFAEFETQTVTGFRFICKNLIEQSSGKREKKDTFIRELDKAASKEIMLKKVTNYMLAGQGFGV